MIVALDPAAVTELPARQTLVVTGCEWHLSALSSLMLGKPRALPNVRHRRTRTALALGTRSKHGFRQNTEPRLCARVRSAQLADSDRVTKRDAIGNSRSIAPLEIPYFLGARIWHM